MNTSSPCCSRSVLILWHESLLNYSWRFRDTGAPIRDPYVYISFRTVSTCSFIQSESRGGTKACGSFSVDTVTPWTGRQDTHTHVQRTKHEENMLNFSRKDSDPIELGMELLAPPAGPSKYPNFNLFIQLKFYYRWLISLFWFLLLINYLLLFPPPPTMDLDIWNPSLTPGGGVWYCVSVYLSSLFWKLFWIQFRLLWFDFFHYLQ